MFGKSSKATPQPGGRLHQLVQSGDIKELARRVMTLQSVALDLHRQLSRVSSHEELARAMALSITGSFGCSRTVVLRHVKDRRHFEIAAKLGVVNLSEEAVVAAATKLAPLLSHTKPLSRLDPAFSPHVGVAASTLSQQGFDRAAWFQVEQKVEFVVLVGEKLTHGDYDEIDLSLLQATFDASTLACSRLLLIEDLEARNRELSEANGRLLQIDELKSAILNGINHELQTPLTRILSYAEALQDDLEQKERDAFLNVILHSAHQLRDRVDDSLTFATAISGRSEARVSPIALHEVIEETCMLFEPVAWSQGIRLETSCEPLTVITNERYVSIIVKNLLDNALRFTPRGGRVAVELSSDGSGACLEVIDSGNGIAEEARERIWRLFEQEDMSLRRESEGFGLGLALSKRLADDLGCHLHLVDSGPEGSCFRLQFEAAVPAEATRKDVESGHPVK